jgi:hypothetical protein
MAPISLADLNTYPAILEDATATSEKSAFSFPPGTPIASLPTIHLARLTVGDKSESRKLLNACKERGFFYLDLRRLENGVLLQGADAIFALSEELFDFRY